MQLQNTSYKLLKFSETIILVLSCLFILYHPSIKKVHILTAVALLLGLVQGDRSSLVIPLIAWLVRNESRISTRFFLLSLVCGFVFLFLWKAIYSFIIAYSLGKDVSFLEMLKSFSFSIIDPVSSYNLTTWVLTDWGINDLYLGYSIFVLPFLMAAPRFLVDFNVNTLAEIFVNAHLPHIAQAGGGRGFGIVAEFYLNFYYFGPLIFGLLWGKVASFIRKRSSSVLLMIFLICNFRIFRSDVASVFKSYIVNFGVIIVFWFVLSSVIKVYLSKVEK